MIPCLNIPLTVQIKLKYFDLTEKPLYLIKLRQNQNGVKSKRTVLVSVKTIKYFLRKKIKHIILEIC